MGFNIRILTPYSVLPLLTAETDPERGIAVASLRDIPPVMPTVLRRACRYLIHGRWDTRNVGRWTGYTPQSR